MPLSRIAAIKNHIIKFLYKASGWKILENNGNIFVLEDKDKIIMRYGYSTTYSIFDKKSLYTHSYFDYFLPLAYLYKRPNVLVIGMGGGTVPMQLKALFGSNLNLEVVDVNKDIMDLAKKYFLKDKNIKMTVSDGAEYVSEKKNAYDLIILDAFEGFKMPQRFLESGFIKDAHAALSENGILGINVDMSDTRTKRYIKLLKERFMVYRLVPILTATNLILICSKGFDKAYITDAVNRYVNKTAENEFLVARYNNL